MTNSRPNFTDLIGGPSAPVRGPSAPVNIYIPYRYILSFKFSPQWTDVHTACCTRTAEREGKRPKLACLHKFLLTFFLG